MDFTLLKKIENGDYCFKLLRANFYRNNYVIIAQTKREFACGSVCAEQNEAENIFTEIAQSQTDPETLLDILSDIQKENSQITLQNQKNVVI